jgi:hypothetical protein
LKGIYLSGKKKQESISQHTDDLSFMAKRDKYMLMN